MWRPGCTPGDTRGGFVSRTVLAASAVAGALALTGLSGGVAAAATPAAPVIDDHGDLKNLHVVLGVGSSIKLRFDECGSCGYHWAFVQRPSKTLVAKASKSRPPHNAPGVVGGSGTHSFTFTGLKGGLTYAKVGYFAPGATEASRVVTVRLRVRS